MLSWLPWLLLWSLLIEFLIQNGSKCSFLFNYYSKLIQILSLLPCLLLWSLLIEFLFETDPNPLLAALASPVLASSSILNRKWCRIPLWLPWLILRSFLIQFLIESDTKSSSGCLSFSCGRFFIQFSRESIQRPPLAAHAPYVFVSYSILKAIYPPSHWLPTLLLCAIVVRSTLNQRRHKVLAALPH